jgi:hypothetical protein
MVQKESEIEEEGGKIMSDILRILLIVFSIGVFFFVFKKIRKAQLNIDDSIYWILFAVFLLVLSVFPQIAIWTSNLLGIESPANFVFLCMLFVIIIKLFQVSIELSVHKHRLNHLVQKLALLNRQQEEMKDENSDK